MATDEPDAPKQEEDEFAGLSPAPPARHPMVAIAVLLLGGVLLWHLRADLGFAFAPGTPVDLGDARALAAQPSDNTFVTLRGMPDRRNALFIEPRGAKARETFFRLLGSSTRILVRQQDPSLRVRLEDRWTGRLRRFDALPYAPSLRGYYQDSVKAARYFSLDEIKKVLGTTQPITIKDRVGEPLALDPSTKIHVDVADPDQVIAYLPREKYPNTDDAVHEVERIGLKVTGKREPNPTDFVLTVAAPVAERAQIFDKLRGLDVGFSRHEERRTVAVGQLKELPPNTESVSVDAPIVIAGDAWVLTEGETPSSFWWAPALALALLAFVAFNVYVLVRRRK